MEERQSIDEAVTTMNPNVTLATNTKKPVNSSWQDLETSHIDRGLLFAFPALFALFNAIYWAILINGGGLNDE